MAVYFVLNGKLLLVLVFKGTLNTKWYIYSLPSITILCSLVSSLVQSIVFETCVVLRIIIIL